jgi:alkanesulfonate monooxygenase SsuD/methylene tetrahydromethanopterin reductase-like flavin-dependent oxidoreductase (luciferase family)
MTRLGRERGWPPLTRPQFEQMASPEGSLLVGDPEAVAAKILRWRDALGMNRFMLHQGGWVSHDKALRSIELLGTEVSDIVRPA